MRFYKKLIIIIQGSEIMFRQLKKQDSGFVQEPKIGEIVVAKLNNIYSVIKSSNLYNDNYFDTIIPDPIEPNYITLLKYEGNCIFTELYTQEKIYFASLEDEQISKIFSQFYKNNTFYTKLGKRANLNLKSFSQYYNLFLDSPLLVRTFETLTDKSKYTIGLQESKHEEITKIIEKIYNKAVKSFEKSFERSLEYDMIAACGEDVVYDFEHGLTRKKTLKDENAE